MTSAATPTISPTVTQRRRHQAALRSAFTAGVSTTGAATSGAGGSEGRRSDRSSVRIAAAPAP